MLLLYANLIFNLFAICYYLSCILFSLLLIYQSISIAVCYQLLLLYANDVHAICFNLYLLCVSAITVAITSFLSVVVCFSITNDRCSIFIADAGCSISIAVAIAVCFCYQSVSIAVCYQLLLL